MVRRLLLFIVCLCCSAALAAANKPANDETKLKQLRSRISTLQADLQQTQGKKKNLSNRLQETELEIGQLARSLRILSDRLKRQGKRLKKLRNLESTQLKNLKSQQDTMARQIRSAFLIGRQERIKLLFNQQDPDKISRMMIFYDYLNRARVKRLEEIEARITQLREVQRQIEKEELKLHKMQQTQLKEKQQLEETQVVRKQVVKGIARELAQGNKALKQLRHDEKQLQRLLTGIRKALDDVAADSPKDVSFKSRKGKLRWPSKGRIAASFGTARIGSLRWEGMMIAAPEGNNVRAVHSGRVAYADWLRGFGLLIIIDHGQGYMTLYGHNQALFKEAGDWVESDEQIALVGSSGGRDRSGVYFGIRFKGKPVNPVKWCKRPRGKRVG